jgi:hypothetical protein
MIQRIRISKNMQSVAKSGFSIGKLGFYILKTRPKVCGICSYSRKKSALDCLINCIDLSSKIYNIVGYQITPPITLYSH